MLYVVATPIGNLADTSLRALDTLRSADCIAAEDTRHTRKLLAHYDIHKPLISYHSQNVKIRGPELLRKMQSGETIALVTDAGTPGISDPGSLLVRQALDLEIQVVSIPGPVALISALVISGLPTQPFAFLGFPPGRGKGRRRFFESYSALPMTVVVYESPQRLVRTLHDILSHWGNRRIAVARELTKKFEEVYRGTVEEAQRYFADGSRGELTLVVGAAEEDRDAVEDSQSWLQELEQLMAREGLRAKEAAGMVAQKYAISRRSAYQAAIALKERLRRG